MPKYTNKSRNCFWWVKCRDCKGMASVAVLPSDLKEQIDDLFEAYEGGEHEGEYYMSMLCPACTRKSDAELLARQLSWSPPEESDEEPSPDPQRKTIFDDWGW